MTSPPFNPNQSLPGDTDFASQYPGVERSFRDIMESWMLIEHDRNGNHIHVSIPQGASPANPASGVDVLFTSFTGRLKIRHSDGSEEYVGTPPGFMGWMASGAVPTGWLEAFGAAVSRSTFADLFSIIGTAYGSGDGSTTFNLPNLAGRVIAGFDTSGLVLSSTYFNANATIFGQTGGLDHTSVLIANVPSGIPVSVSGSFTGATDAGKPLVWDTGGLASSAAAGGGLGQFANINAVHREASIAVAGSILGSGSANGSGNPISVVQPTILLRPIIKY